jgi:amino acid transporter
MIAQVMACARQYYSLGRDDVFHRYLNQVLTRVHLVSGAPRSATLVVGAFSAACCFLSAHVLLVFLSGLTVYGLALVCLAVLVGRARRLTGQAGYWRAPLHPLAPILGLVMAAIFAVSDLADADGRPSLVILGLVIAAAVAWQHFVLRRRPGGWTPRLG